MTYFTAQQISQHIHRIVTIGGVCVYLVKGSKQAALIDTGFGVGDLKGMVESMIDTPYVVLLSHGHLDHVGGAAQFETVYLHPADWELSAWHATLARRKQDIGQLAPDLELPAQVWMETRQAPCLPLADGQLFDLGDVQVRAVEVPGHTAGSVIFVIPQDRAAILGDACGEGTLIRQEMLQTYEKGLEHLMEYAGEFDVILRNHGTYYSKKAIVQDNLELVRDILAGRDAAVRDCVMGVNGYFGRERVHPGKEGNIFYAPSEQATW